MTMKKLILLVLLGTVLATCLGGCSLAGSALQGTGQAFSKVGSSVKSL